MTRRWWGAAGVLAALVLLVAAVLWWRGKPPVAAPEAVRAWVEVGVVGPDGKAASGAAVALMMPGASAALGARSDATGAARIGPVAVTTVQLSVRLAGAAHYDRELILVAATNRVQVKLEPAVTLAGVVVDEAGTPVAGAALQVRRDEPSATSRTSVFEATSDTAGRFRFDQLPAGSYALQASAELHELAVLPNTSAPSNDKDPLRVVLQRTAALRGEVRDYQGEPAPGATVTIAGSGVWPPKTLETDARGHFELSPVPGGVYELRAKRTTFTSAPEEGVLVEPAAAAYVRLTLQPGATLHGRAFDAESGAVLRGVAVTVGEDALSSVPNHATTAIDGTFAIEGLRRLPHRVWMHAPGYVPIAGDPLTPRDQAYEFPLRRSATLSGVIVDEAGQPVPNAELEVTGTTDTGQRVQVSSVVVPTLSLGRPAVPLVAPTGDSLGVTFGAVPKIPLVALPGNGADALALTPDLGFRSDASGRFRIEGVPPGRIQIAARRSGFAVGRSPLRDVRSGDAVSDLRIVLPLGGTLLGRVVDARGFPVASVRMQVDVTGEPSARVTLTAEDGRFEFAALRGACSITAFPLSGASVRQAFEVASGERREIELMLGGETRALIGRVLDGRGFPIAGALVHVEPEGARGSTPRAASSAADGTFQVTSLPPPPYRVVVEHADYASTQVRSASPAVGEELAITLHPGARVTGLVIDQMTNNGIEGARVRLRGANAKDALSARSDVHGKFEIRNVTLGAYEVIVDEPQHVTARGKTVVSEPGTREIDPVVLLPAGSVSGDVVDRLGAPVFNAEVAVGQPSVWTQAVRTDHRGHFALPSVAPGEQRVSARHTQAGATQVPVRVYARQESPGLVLRLPGQPEP